MTISDRVNGALLATFGNQVIAPGIDQAVSHVFYAKRFGAYEMESIRRGVITHVLLDYRLLNGKPILGYFFANNPLEEYFLNQNEQQIPPDSFTKFEVTPNVNRVFDSGDIRIYDIGVFTR